MGKERGEENQALEFILEENQQMMRYEKKKRGGSCRCANGLGKRGGPCAKA